MDILYAVCIVHCASLHLSTIQTAPKISLSKALNVSMNRKIIGNCLAVSAVFALFYSFLGTDMYQSGTFEAVENGISTIAELNELTGLEKVRAIIDSPGIFSYVFFLCFSVLFSSTLLVSYLNEKNT